MDTTDSEPPKSAVTVVAWKQPLGRAPVLLYILQGRSEARDALFFSFRFFKYPRYKLLSPRSFNNNFCCRTSAPTIITNNISNERTQQSLPTNQPLTASSSEQSILDFPDDTCRILPHLLRDARFCSRANQVSDARRFILTVATPVHPTSLFLVDSPRLRQTVLSTDLHNTNQHSKHRHPASTQNPPNRDQAF
jgi:hypothetical protein